MRSIDVLNNLENWDFYVQPHYEMTEDEALEVIEALKKSIPRISFLQEEIDGYDINGFPRIYKVHRCPNCKVALKTSSEYCPACGQKVVYK